MLDRQRLRDMHDKTEIMNLQTPVARPLVGYILFKDMDITIMSATDVTLFVYFSSVQIIQ